MTWIIPTIVICSVNLMIWYASISLFQRILRAELERIWPEDKIE